MELDELRIGRGQIDEVSSTYRRREREMDEDENRTDYTCSCIFGFCGLICCLLFLFFLVHLEQCRSCQTSSTGRGNTRCEEKSWKKKRG